VIRGQSVVSGPKRLPTTPALPTTGHFYISAYCVTLNVMVGEVAVSGFAPPVVALTDTV